jgi:hypothetical protein
MLVGAANSYQFCTATLKTFFPTVIRYNPFPSELVSNGFDGSTEDSMTEKPWTFLMLYDWFLFAL